MSGVCTEESLLCGNYGNSKKKTEKSKKQNQKKTKRKEKKNQQKFKMKAIPKLPS